jgi:tRNA(Ile2) C34 agmatinyltransferase TiaS
MLDELLVGVWEGLAAHRVAQCPVCGGEMHAEYGVHSRPVGGRCKTCGTTLN